ncbi:MAG: CBS domain-containing protein [Gemmatimonadota bacterium]
MRALDIMTANLHVVLPDEPIAAPAAIMADYSVGLVPVVSDFEEMRLEGVITDRDITVRHVAPRHGEGCLVRDHMTKDHLDVVRASDHVHDVIGRMRHDQLRRVLVIDAERRLVGIIAQADIALRVGPIEPVLVEQLLEEISEPVSRTKKSLLALAMVG